MMTDEERQELCDALRHTHPSRSISATAADEIERLAALAQSDAEPVAWPDIDAAVKAGLAWRNPAPDAAPSAHTNVKTVTIGGAQSDAEPVAWQWQEKATPEFGWAFCRNEEEMIYLAQYPSKYSLRPLYATPPRPDASTGLIEAAEIAEQCANDSLSENEAMHLQDFATKLRAIAAVRNNPEAFAKLKAFRATDRSGKP